MTDEQKKGDSSGKGPAATPGKKAGTAEELKEASFFVEQGLFEEALDLLTELKRENPALPGIDKRIAEVKAKRAAAGGTGAAPSPTARRPQSSIQERLQALKERAKSGVIPAGRDPDETLKGFPLMAERTEPEKPAATEEAKEPEPEPVEPEAAEEESEPEPVEPEATPEATSEATEEGDDAVERRSDRADTLLRDGEDQDDSDDEEDVRGARASDRADTLIWEGARSQEGAQNGPSTGNWKFYLGVLLGLAVGVLGTVVYQRYTIVPRKEKPTKTPAETRPDASPPATRPDGPDGTTPSEAPPPRATADGRKPTAAARAAADAAVARPPVRPAVEKVRLTLTVKPQWAKANIQFRGTWYRRNRFRSPPAPPRKEREPVLIKANGFYTRKIYVVLDRNVTREVALMQRKAK
jgi:hypothetical protein